MTNPPQQKLRWYQYSLSSLFVLTTLVAIVCSWYATEVQKAAKRRAAIAEIVKLGGGVHYYDASRPKGFGESPGWFSWLRRLHGDVHLGNAVYIDLMGTRTTDAGLVHLKGLTELEGLAFWDTQITDAGLENLKGLTKLERLSFWHTQVTDAGLVHLKGLTKLGWLALGDTQITDAGLVHLEGLTKLEELNFENTQITDAGLVHLKGMTRLGTLYLQGTQVTDEGVKHLQQALPNCYIDKPVPVVDQTVPVVD